MRRPYKKRSVTVRFTPEEFQRLAAIQLLDHRRWWSTSDHIREAVRVYVKLLEGTALVHDKRRKTHAGKRKTTLSADDS